MTRIDTVARDQIAHAAEARARFKQTGRVADMRESLAPHTITVYRTDADLRTVDLSLDPSERPYGSLFGRRPDLINYGLVGLGRLTTPEAWLSTWSGISSRAAFGRCAPAVTAPTLFLEVTGDQAAFPADTRNMVAALGASNQTHLAVRGTHFGGPIAEGEPTGNELAGIHIRDWLATRYELTPPSQGSRPGSHDPIDNRRRHRSDDHDGRCSRLTIAGGTIDPPPAQIRHKPRRELVERRLAQPSNGRHRIRGVKVADRLAKGVAGRLGPKSGIMPCDASLPTTSTPFRATGTPTRPVPMSNFKALPPPAKSAKSSTVWSTSERSWYHST